MDGDSQPQSLSTTNWVELGLKQCRFSNGVNRLKLLVTRGELMVDWFEFK
jgi:hypothetical protein